MMGLPDGPKKFSDRCSRFDTIPAVTDSHPASHVAVAITLNAKASSLKTTITFSVILTEITPYAHTEAIMADIADSPLWQMHC